MGHNADVMRVRTLRIACLLLLVGAAPCHAWLYDSGVPNLAGQLLKDGSGVEWAASPFRVAQDSYGTVFGAPVARGYGTAGAGLTMTLATWSWTDYRPGPAIEAWTITPLNTLLTYYYANAASPITLRADTTYCLVFASNDPGFAGVISYTLKPGLYYGWGTSDHGASWGQLPYPVCVRVDGYVPEPSSLCVLIAMLCGAIGTVSRTSRRPPSRSADGPCGLRAC